MPDFSDNEIVRTRRRSSSRHGGMVPRARDDPGDSVEEVYVHRLKSHDEYAPRARSADYRNDFGRGRSTSRSTSSRRQQSTVREEGRVMRYESDSDSSRRRASSKQISKRENTNIVPCSDLCNDNPYKPRFDSKDKDSDWDDYSSEEERRKEKKARNRKLIAAGLASITTVAAANNIYQSSKAHKARRRLVSEGRMCTSELKRQKTNAIMLDLFSVGVAAIGVNNAVNGWKSMENQRREHHKAYERHIEKREYHEQKLLTGPDMPRVPQLGWDRREEVYVR